MAYKTVDIAAPGITLGGFPRDRPLPDGVEVRLLKQIGNAGHRKDGDHFIEYFYADAKAERAHRLMLERR